MFHRNLTTDKPVLTHYFQQILLISEINAKWLHIVVGNKIIKNKSVRLSFTDLPPQTYSYVAYILNINRIFFGKRPRSR